MGISDIRAVVVTAPVVVGVPEYGPCEVTPVTWLETMGGTALVKPGISVAGSTAYEATDET